MSKEEEAQAEPSRNRPSEGCEENDPVTLPELTPEATERIRRVLLRWYDAHRRPLPWRGEKDPYRIWVAEVMLQQTRVETAAPYYRRWLERFPTLKTLAGATEEEVLRAWEGLGYYGRAMRLMATARVVMEKYGGELPRSVAQLRLLPGVGPYTAGAVGSIAYGQPVAAVDGNVRRLLFRWFFPSLVDHRGIEAVAQALVDPRRPGDFNQALMEVGSAVCLPRSPRCGACPLAGVCGARRSGVSPPVSSLAARRRVSKAEEVVVVAWRKRAGKVLLLLRRRPSLGLLGGLWEFPGVQLEPAADRLSTAAAVLADLGLAGHAPPLPLPAVRHAFTHRKVLYHPFLWEVASGLEGTSGRWVEKEKVEGELILPAAQKRILAMARRVLGTAI